MHYQESIFENDNPAPIGYLKLRLAPTREFYRTEVVSRWEQEQDRKAFLAIAIPQNTRGVYGIYEDGVLVYIGKSSKDILSRWRKYKGDYQKTSFDFSRLEFAVWTDDNAESNEHFLIEHYRPRDNGTGKGANALGRNRKK